MPTWLYIVFHYQFDIFVIIFDIVAVEVWCFTLKFDLMSTDDYLEFI